MTAAVSAWARTIIPMNSTGAGVEAGPQLFLTTASVSDYNEIGGEAWDGLPCYPITYYPIIIGPPVITDDRIIIARPPDQKRSAVQYQLSA